jgi:putative addiction module killer protein
VVFRLRLVLCLGKKLLTYCILWDTIQDGVLTIYPVILNLEYTISYLELRNGKKPFIEWLKDLDENTKLRLMSRLKRLRLGNFGDSKFLGDDVHELKCDFGPGYRIYFAKKGVRIIVLINGGNKKTQERDIEKAKALWEFYLNGGRYD